MKAGGKKPRFAVDTTGRVSEFKKLYQKRARFEPVTKFTSSPRAEDPEVLTKCNREDHHVITLNVEHFKKYRKSMQTINIGVIAISIKDSKKSIEKFGNLLQQHPYHEDYRNKFCQIGNKIKITDLKTKSVEEID